MPEFHMPLALKIINISECLCYLPDKVTIFLNLTPLFIFFARKMSEFYVIIARKNICSRILGVRAPISYAYVDRQHKRHYTLPKKGSQDKQKLNN